MSGAIEQVEVREKTGITWPEFLNKPWGSTTDIMPPILSNWRAMIDMSRKRSITPYKIKQFFYTQGIDSGIIFEEKPEPGTMATWRASSSEGEIVELRISENPKNTSLMLNRKKEPTTPGGPGAFRQISLVAEPKKKLIFNDTRGVRISNYRIIQGERLVENMRFIYVSYDLNEKNGWVPYEVSELLFPPVGTTIYESHLKANLNGFATNDPVYLRIIAGQEELGFKEAGNKFEQLMLRLLPPDQSIL